jgi:hypothetical protein
MRRSDIGSRIALVRLLRDQNAEMPRWSEFWKGLSLVWNRLESRPTFVFVLLSFAFGSAISVVLPPLRGPDEIAHFLRIYSYTRGDLLPTAEVDGRKGIFIEHELCTQLSFFKNAGEHFARNREQGLRYGEIMKEYPHRRHTPWGGASHEVHALLWHRRLPPGRLRSLPSRTTAHSYLAEFDFRYNERAAAFPPKVEVHPRSRYVAQVPRADSCTAAKHIHSMALLD